MANSKTPQKGTSSNTGQKPSGGTAKKADKQPVANKPVKTITKQTAAREPKNNALGGVIDFYNKVSEIDYTWARKAWSKAGQATDPATKVLREIVDKMTKTTKSIPLPQDVYRRISGNFDFSRKPIKDATIKSGGEAGPKTTKMSTTDKNSPTKRPKTATKTPGMKQTPRTTGRTIK